MNQQGHTRRAVLGGAIAAGLTYHRPARARSGTMRVGCLSTLTGPFADLGRAHAQGAQIAVNQINQAGGVDGQVIELVVRDTKFSPAEAVAGLRELRGDDIDLFMGDFASHINLATAPLMPSLKAILIAPSAIAMELTKELFNRNVFRCGPNAYMQYNGQTVLMAKHNPDVVRWGGIQPDNAGFKAGWDMTTTMLKVNYPKYAGKQVQIVDPVVVKSGATDYRTQINQLVGQKLEGFILLPVGSDAISFLQQARPFGLMKNIKAVADNNLNVTAGPALKQNLPNNFWTSCMWQLEPYKQYPMAQAFADDCIKLTKDPNINPYCANGHTVITSLAAAVRAAKTTEPEAVIRALETITFDSVYGPLAYRAADHQLQIGPGYMLVVPQDTEPGWRVEQFVRIPWEEVADPATPGIPFSL